MKKLVLAVVLGIALTEFGETVTNVRGVQRSNSNLVDIYYDLNATDGGTYTVEVAIEGRADEVPATTFSGDVGKGIAPGKNHRVVWDARADWRGNKGEIKAVVTATVEARIGKKPNKVQLWAGGPYWADRNIGADNPWEYGLYFWWGDTTGHRPTGTTFNFSFTWEYSSTSRKDVSTLRSEGWITSNGVLSPRHDAAHVKWGGNWRMPTNKEFNDLNNKCDWIWTTMNGVSGYVVHGKGDYASNSIFLPCAGGGRWTSLYDTGLYGNYWSSVTGSDNDYAWRLNLDSDKHDTRRDTCRNNGYSVRPVQ